MTLIEILIIWNISGFAVWLAMAVFDGSPMNEASGFEFCNPVWLYEQYRVNYFGAGFLALLFSLMCPVYSLGYWFYKLCTVGRR
jgi:hypothetical protein